MLSLPWVMAACSYFRKQKTNISKTVITIGITLLLEEFCFDFTQSRCHVCGLENEYNSPDSHVRNYDDDLNLHPSLLFMVLVQFLRMLVETDGAIYSQLSGCNSSPFWAFCVLFSTRPCQMLSQEPTYVTKYPVTNKTSV